MSNDKEVYYNIFVVGIVSGIFAFALGVAMLLYSESTLGLLISVTVIILSFVFDIIALLSYKNSLVMKQ